MKLIKSGRCSTVNYKELEKYLIKLGYISYDYNEAYFNRNHIKYKYVFIDFWDDNEFTIDFENRKRNFIDYDRKFKIKKLL